jgi:predicted small integral membrane protein
MRLIARLGTQSLAVAVLTVITAVQMILVTVDNVIDYDTNYAFVQHVLSMDTTFRSPHLMWRAMAAPGFATAAYLVVIVWEALTAAVLVAASAAWILRRPLASRLSAAGWLLELTLFAGGFLAVGGEWFQMWQSSKWNGLESATRYLLVTAVGLILVHRLPGSTGPQDRSGGHREPALEDKLEVGLEDKLEDRR